ncbi:reverse transcriptase domain-containing protein [Caerostris extrusa]|uniref:Reverse transcriptase domain-containing protein n=1 Tax=Caerostris extrusa TaxID=172846 RepID=A0AAV4UFC9_CAEEX|nr:reverse transcriptase domain-containing protein [Caerostris extrusa]
MGVINVSVVFYAEFSVAPPEREHLAIRMIRVKGVELCEKGRKRLQLLKYISGRDWGADAGTLKITYTALIRPILEYGYQIYQVAAKY